MRGSVDVVRGDGLSNGGGLVGFMLAQFVFDGRNPRVDVNVGVGIFLSQFGYRIADIGVRGKVGVVRG